MKKYALHATIYMRKTTGLPVMVVRLVPVWMYQLGSHARSPGSVAMSRLSEVKN